MNPVCLVNEITAGAGKEFCVDGPDNRKIWIALFRCDEQIVGYQNACPHQGRALNWAPDRFMFSDEGQLVCSHHGASFNLNDGLCVSGPCTGASLKPVALRITDDRVFLLEPPSAP